MGNRTLEQKKNKCGKVVEYSKYLYNDSNQLISEETYNGKKTSKLSYTNDADGNRISETGKIGCKKVNKTYEYSVENRLEAVYDGKTLLMAAAYDGDGNRVFQLNYNPDEDNACCNKNFDKHPTACNRNPKTNGQQMPVKDDGKGDDGKDASKDRTGCQSGSQFGQIRCTDGSEDVPERKVSCTTQKEEHSCGILIPEKEEISETEEALLDKIKGWGNKKNYELTEYVNDVNRKYTEVLVEQNISGKMETAYVYGNERLSSDCCNGRSSYYLYDPRGSVTGITNEDGKIYQSYRYNAFGEITFGAPEHENAYTYNGESYNPNIESQYLRARYYDVTTGSFLTEDSYLGDINQPLTLNRYNYCVSNPVNYQDPSGHFVETLLDVVSIGVSIYDCVKDPSPANFGWLALDVVSAFVPGMPGSYVFKGVKAAADVTTTAVKTTKTVNKVTKAAKTVDKIKDVGKTAVKGIQKAVKTTGDEIVSTLFSKGTKLIDNAKSGIAKAGDSYKKLKNAVKNSDAVTKAKRIISDPKTAGKEAVAKAQTYLDSLVSKSRQNAFIDGCAKKIEKFTENSRETIQSWIKKGKASDDAIFKILDDYTNGKPIQNIDAKALMEKRGVTQTLTNDEIKIANQLDLQMNLNKSGSKTIDDIIDNLPETTNGKGVARNFESTGGFDHTIKDFDDLNPIDVKEIQTQYGPGKVGKLSDGTTVVARPGSTTGGATLEIRVSNSKVYKIRY